jgi:fused signal recognition particle receptor
MLGLLGGGDLDEESWEAIEDTLLVADLGPTVTEAVVTALRSRMASSSVRTEDDARAVLREVLISQLQPDLDRSIKALPTTSRPRSRCFNGSRPGDSRTCARRLRLSRKIRR